MNPFRFGDSTRRDLKGDLSKKTDKELLKLVESTDMYIQDYKDLITECLKRLMARRIWEDSQDDY